MQTVEAGHRIAIKNVLWATDFSLSSKAALPYAISVARRYEATLHAAHIVPIEADMSAMSPDHWPALLEEEDRIIEGYVEQLENQLQGAPHEVWTRRGKIPEALADIVEEQDIDLLVLGPHGRTGVRKLFAGSVAETIFRRVRCPVLTVGPNLLSKPNDEIQFRHILFATDFSKGSLAALPYAISMSEEDQAQLTLLHVIGQPAAGILDLKDVITSVLGRLKELVTPEAEPWCKAECKVEFGQLYAPPAERILEIARDRKADLIVLGVRPVHGDLGVVTHLASTTAQILTQAACPVLTVPGQYAE
jgi:nucleotide-binding universal stress UspA family protein